MTRASDRCCRCRRCSDAADAAAHAILVRQNFIDGAVDWKIGRITFGEDFASFSVRFPEPDLLRRNLVGNYIYNCQSANGHQTEVQPAGLRLFSVRCV